MRKSWKVVRRREHFTLASWSMREEEKVLAELPERVLAELCCESFHRLLHRRGDAWFIESPEGKRFAVDLPASCRDLVDALRSSRKRQAVRS